MAMPTMMSLSKPTMPTSGRPTGPMTQPRPPTSTAAVQGRTVVGQQMPTTNPKYYATGAAIPQSFNSISTPYYGGKTGTVATPVRPPQPGPSGGGYGPQGRKTPDSMFGATLLNNSMPIVPLNANQAMYASSYKTTKASPSISYGTPTATARVINYGAGGNPGNPTGTGIR